MNRSTFRVLFYAKGSKEKNGIVPLMGRVTINGTVAQFSCKQTTPKNFGMRKGTRLRTRVRKPVKSTLHWITSRLKSSSITNASDWEAYVNADMVRNAYQGIGNEYETLLKAFDKDCTTFQKRVGKDRSIGTYKVMIKARNYVAAFIKSYYKRTDMSMLELTPDFIKEFAVYLSKLDWH